MKHTILPTNTATWYYYLMSNITKLSCFFLCVYIFCFFSCTQSSNEVNPQKDLFTLLEDPLLSSESKFSIINQIASFYETQNSSTELILFLTDYVEKNPRDVYNAYWLLLTAHIYMEYGAEKVAEYYFDRILQNYDDLLVKDKSIHVVCLENLLKISDSAENRATYFNHLINRFPNNVDITELYMRLAMEYENLGDWEQAIKTYSLFLEQPDATTIQIPGIPNAYSKARKLIDFNNSPKDWTFESLEALETAVKNAISRNNYTALDSYRSKVNFFAMSWKQEETDDNSQKSFSMRDYGLGNRIRFSAELDESSNPNEAYLRTTGWSRYISLWYLYFRKVNFPLNPEIHGRWEWAGIFFGEKL